MNPTAQRALERLRSREHDASHQLIGIFLKSFLDRPIGEWLAPTPLAQLVQLHFELAARSNLIASSLESSFDRLRHRAEGGERPIHKLLPTDIIPITEQLLERSWSPDEALVFRLIDQPAIRSMVSDILEDSLTRFQKRLKSLDATGLGSLGARVARKGRGLLGGVAHNLGSAAQNLSGLAENLVGAVTEEIEHAVQSRIREFVDHATTDAIKNIARRISDPKYAATHSELRIGLFRTSIDIPVETYMKELDKLDFGETVEGIRKILLTIVTSKDFSTYLTETIHIAVEPLKQKTLAEVLEEAGLHESWTTQISELLLLQMRQVVDSPSFEGWWETLFAK